MAVDKPIGFTPDPPPFPEETEQMAQNVVDIQVEEANPNVEMACGCGVSVTFK